MDSSEGLCSRRLFLSTGLAATTLAADPQTAAAPAPQTASAPAPAIFDINHRKLLAPADLLYEKPVAPSEEDIPLGNGRMGSLVWTTGSSIRMQINRVDAYANDSSTNSFFERHNDYCGGCGYVDIDFGGAGEDPFPAAGFGQRLSVYDGLLTLNGKGFTARLLGWPAQDVMAIAVDERRTPEAIHVNLRMLRYETKYFGAQLESFAGQPYFADPGIPRRRVLLQNRGRHRHGGAQRETAAAQ